MDQLDDENFEPAVRPLITILEQERPLPSPGFRGRLKRMLALDGVRAENLPLLRRLALSCGASGTALFAVAALGIAGAGPLAS